MAKEFKLQDPGEGLHEAEISEVHVEEGDTVAEDDLLLTVETDKVSVEIPAPFSGTIEDLKVSVGDEVRVGEVLMTYTENGDGESEDEEDDAAEDDDEKKDDEKRDDEEAADEDEGDDEDEDEDERPQKKEKRRTRKKSDEDDEDEDEDDEDDRKKKRRKKSDRKSRKKDRKDQEDDEKSAKSEKKKRKKRDEKKREGKKKQKDEDRDDTSTDDERPVPASPATRRLARELEVDLREIEGSGPEGRVTQDDVRAAAGEEADEGEGRETEDRKAKDRKAKDTDTSDESGADERSDVELPRLQTPDLPDFERFGEVERVPMRGVRKVTAARMALAASQIASVTHQDEADVTELERFRRDHRDEIEESGGKLTLTVFAMKAVVSALQEFPRFNASLDVDAGEMVVKKYFHVGVAVDTGRGLLVPVVRDVDRKSIRELSVELKELAERTREGEATRDDLTGGTFTITNPGPLGGTGFSPIINWPEVAILGMGRATLRPIVLGDLDDSRTVNHVILPLSLSFDHRVVDGAEAARFTRAVIDRLEDPSSLLLDA